MFNLNVPSRLCSSNALAKIVCDYTGKIIYWLISFIITTYSNYIGVSYEYATKFLRRYKPKKLDTDLMIDSFETFKKFGYTSEQILKNGKLFNFFPREHEQHKWVMEEGGFTDFRPEILIRYTRHL